MYSAATRLAGGVSFLVAALVLAGSVVRAERSPYTEHVGREIKALSPAEVEDYLAGRGMGLALAAELNRYPGPMHVLELASELALNEEQHRQVQTAFDAMRAAAIRLGREVVDEERRLDKLFAEGSVTSEALRDTLVTLGRLHGELRSAHLTAHLETREILTPEQVDRHEALRGYASEDSVHHGHHRQQ